MWFGMYSKSDISCQIPFNDYSIVKSADDNKPTTTDEEDIITILEDMKEPLMYSHTAKGAKSEKRGRKLRDQRLKHQKDSNGLPVPTIKDLNSPLQKNGNSTIKDEEDEATIKKREERKRRIKEMMQKLYEKDKSILGLQESTNSLASVLPTAKHKEAESSDCEILLAETSSVTSDVTETDSSTSKCHQLSSLNKEESNSKVSTKMRKTSNFKDDSSLTKKSSNSKESFELKLRKQVKKTLEMLKNYPKFASPHSIIDEQISSLGQTFTNLSSMTDAICDDVGTTSSYDPNSDHNVSIVQSPSYGSAKKSKKNKKFSKSENKNSISAMLDDKLRDDKLRSPSSLTTKASASQPHVFEASQFPNKKIKLKHPKPSTKGSSEERNSHHKSGSKFSSESGSTADDLVKSLVSSLANSSRVHHSSSSMKYSSQNSKEDKHLKQKKITPSGKINTERSTIRHKSRDKHRSGSSDSSSDDSSSSSSSSSSGKKNGSESERRRRHHSRKHLSSSHKKRRHNHKSKSKRSHKPPSKSHHTSSSHRKSRRRSRDKRVLSD